MCTVQTKQKKNNFFSNENKEDGKSLQELSNGPDTIEIDKQSTFFNKKSIRYEANLYSHKTKKN